MDFLITYFMYKNKSMFMDFYPKSSNTTLFAISHEPWHVFDRPDSLIMSGLD